MLLFVVRVSVNMYCVHKSKYNVSECPINLFLIFVENYSTNYLEGTWPGLKLLNWGVLSFIHLVVVGLEMLF